MARRGRSEDEGTVAQMDEQEQGPKPQVDVVFEEPPKIERTHDSEGVWVKRLEPLKEHPGKWARVYGPLKNPAPVVTNLNSGKAKGINPGEWHFAGRKVDGQGYLFAIYLTDEQRAEKAVAAEEGRRPKIESV